MKNEKEVKRISKFLSLVLRHKPQTIHLNLDNQGWTSTRELLEKYNKHRGKLDIETLEYVVANNNKKRFAFNADKTKIRASQGHSIKIELAYNPVEPPEYLYHGTATKYINIIRKEGLKKQNRHHVHLSADLDTATNVGSRHGVPVILRVKAKEMHEDGMEFYCSENSVWLTDHVPTNYFLED